VPAEGAFNAEDLLPIGSFPLLGLSADLRGAIVRLVSSAGARRPTRGRGVGLH